MRNKTIITLFGCTALLLTACNIKDPIFNTSHPGHAMVTLTTEWSAIGSGLAAPESYTVKASLSGSNNPAAGYSATLTGVTNKLDHLFEPGNYRFYVYNTPERITISGTVASAVAEAVTPMDAGAPIFRAGPADNPEQLVHSAPGWLFTSTLDAALQADTEHALTAPMQQQVRQLTLVIEPTGETADRIESISAMLSGVAGTFDMESGAHGSPAHVPLTFSKITSGADAGKWSATVRLLGIAGERQWLTGMIRFKDNEPGNRPLDSDLSAALAAFNADKRQPLTLDGKTVETPSEAGFEATIEDWVPGNGDGENIEANSLRYVSL